MKTIKTITMMVALTVIANIALATGNLKVNILPLTAERAVIAISNSADSQFEIEVKDAYGEILYYNQTKGQSNEYNKVYDFSRLETGDYKLVVNIDGEVSERAFTIERSKINVGATKNIVKPFFTYKNEILRVAYLNFADEDLKLSVYSEGDLLYNKALENTFSVNEGLNLSKLKSGEYQVVLSTESENYNYSLNVE
ncbi:hypothetical protein ACUNWD_11145 [Sunxiuqinia sp. A32]|uniref:hypothetical protein n=1 Tax=Sunxiuqinia sp. A32 TaxID=3461496 RepID=UPI004045F3F5